MAVPSEGKPVPRIGPYVIQSTTYDGWSIADSATGPGPTPGPHGDRFPPARPMPPEVDSWDFDPNIKLSDEPYRGVRRASAAWPRLKTGVVVGVVVGLVLLGAAISLIMAASPDAGQTTRAGENAESPGSMPSDAGAPASPQLSASDVARTGSAVDSAVPAFAPLAFEAEGGPPSIKRHGTDVEAQAGASGGEVVRFVGESSEIEIRGVLIPAAGSYRITIYYLSEGAATALVTVTSAAPLTVGFAGGTGCCSATAVDVAMQAGRQSIIISNAGGGPAIDKVVITRPLL